MKSFAPMIPSIMLTRSGNRRRVGSCRMVGAESKYRTPRVSSSHPPAASTDLIAALPSVGFQYLTHWGSEPRVIANRGSRTAFPRSPLRLRSSPLRGLLLYRRKLKNALDISHKTRGISPSGFSVSQAAALKFSSTVMSHSSRDHSGT